MKTKAVSVLLAAVFVITLTTPVFAGVDYSAVYEIDGTVDLKRQAGHLCNTGAEQKQAITGDGEISKTSNIAMVPGKISVEDVNDFVAGESNLTVTSVIKLCAPPKYEANELDLLFELLLDLPYNGPNPEDYEMIMNELWSTWREFFFQGSNQGDVNPELVNHALTDIKTLIIDLENERARIEDIVENPDQHYVDLSPEDREAIRQAYREVLEACDRVLEYFRSLHAAIEAHFPVPGAQVVVDPRVIYSASDQPYIYGRDGFEGMNYDMIGSFDNWDPVSKQIWAVQVSADPGFSGSLHQDFEAAYGPYSAGRQLNRGDDNWNGVADDAWGWASTDLKDVVVGDDYVGNYFNIGQLARTSMGTVQRFIDISSPFSHAYLHEDMSIVGASEIEEAFSMNNIQPGSDMISQWWDLF